MVITFAPHLPLWRKSASWRSGVCVQRELTAGYVLRREVLNQQVNLTLDWLLLGKDTIFILILKTILKIITPSTAFFKCLQQIGFHAFFLFFLFVCELFLFSIAVVAFQFFKSFQNC